MDASALEIAPPRRAFLFIFLVTGVVLLLNGLAVLVFAPIPRSAGAIQPGFGVGGLMPIVAGLLCLAGAGWMLNRHRQIAGIIELVQAELPEDGTDPDSRGVLVDALTARAKHLRRSLTTFPEALVTIELAFEASYRLSVDLSGQATMSGHLSPVDDRLAKQIENEWEGIRHGEEMLLDFANSEAVGHFVDRFSSEILQLPPDYTLSGNVKLSKRPGQEA